MSPFDPVLRAGDIRATNASIKAFGGVLEDSTITAGADTTPEQKALASLLVRRLANTHGCRCPDPAHAAGEFHACRCRRSGHRRDVAAAFVALEALGLTGASEGRDERLNEWGVRRYPERRAKPGG